jgi:hypothetical protein
LLLPLLRALASSGRDDDFARVMRLIQESPNEFSLDFGHLPALKSLIPWSHKKFGSIYPPLQSWFETVRNELERSTAEEPVPPSDWARPVAVECRCNFCTQLNTFLADPRTEIVQIPAGEERRQHLIHQIQRHKCDVKHSLERSGRPYSLILTKTTGSHDRAVVRYKKDRRLLRELEALV